KFTCFCASNCRPICSQAGCIAVARTHAWSEISGLLQEIPSPSASVFSNSLIVERIGPPRRFHSKHCPALFPVEIQRGSVASSVESLCSFSPMVWSLIVFSLRAYGDSASGGAVFKVEIPVGALRALFFDPA